MLFKVIRLNTSPYSKTTLFTLEKERFDSLKIGPHRLKLESTAEAYDGKCPIILLTNSQTEPDLIPESVLRGTTLLIHPNSGYDNFSSEFVKKATFPIVLGNTIRRQAVVEFVLSALFSHYCPLPHHSIWDHERQFNRSLLSQKKIIILGQGHIGKSLTTMLSILGCEIYNYDPILGPKEWPKEKMDVAILALGLNAKTRHIVDKTFLQKRMNHHFLLINPARGELIEEHDLLECLKKSPDAHAIVDVFHPEPKDLSLFIGLPNIRLSSHIAGVYNGLNHAMVDFEAKVISDFLKNLKLFFKLYQNNFLQQRLHQGKLL